MPTKHEESIEVIRVFAYIEVYIEQGDHLLRGDRREDQQESSIRITNLRERWSLEAPKERGSFSLFLAPTWTAESSIVEYSIYDKMDHMAAIFIKQSFMHGL